MYPLQGTSSYFLVVEVNKACAGLLLSYENNVIGKGRPRGILSITCDFVTKSHIHIVEKPMKFR